MLPLAGSDDGKRFLTILFDVFCEVSQRFDARGQLVGQPSGLCLKEMPDSRLKRLAHGSPHRVGHDAELSVHFLR
ncbi:MAG: hypothetical protein V3V08_23680 [Nannocystaceae bacterium]